MASLLQSRSRGFRRLGTLRNVTTKRRRSRDAEQILNSRKTIPTVNFNVDLSMLGDKVDDSNLAIANCRNSVNIRLSWRGAEREEYTRAATLDRLLDRVVSADEFKNTSALDAFFITYQIYLKADDLFERFMLRFNEAVASNEIEQQLRVVEVLQFWVDAHADNFEDSENLGQKMNEFIALRNKLRGIINPKVESALDALARTMDRFDGGESLASSNYESRFSQTDLSSKEKEILTVVEESSLQPWEFLADSILTPRDIAEQLTNVEVAMFRKIMAVELLGVAWSREGKDETSPNVRKLIGHFNQMSRWVAGIILETDSDAARVNMCQKFIEVALHCKNLNNFNAVFEILAGVNSVAVHRLKLLEKLPTEVHAEYTRLHEFIRAGGNYNSYRKEVTALREDGVGCVPFLGVSFGDLRSIEMTMDDFEETPSGKTLINFKKQRQVAGIIRELLDSFSPNFDIEEIKPLEAFIKAEIYNTTITDDDLWNLSCQILPSK